MGTPDRLLAALVTGLLLAGCSSSGDDKAATTEPTASLSATPLASASTATSARPSASVVPSASGASAATAPSASASASPGGAAPASSIKGTAPGDYTYDAKGTYSLGGAPQQVEGTSTLTVSPLQGNRQTSTLHAEQGGDTVQDLVIESGGVKLARLSIGTPVNKEFRNAPPVLLFPTPATVGRSWSWRSTSTDGSSTLTTTNKVVRTETLTIGGQRVATVVLQSRLVITGDVTYTADVTTWVATAYRLPVKDHTKGSGRFGQIQFSTDITSVMRSVRPA